MSHQSKGRVLVVEDEALVAGMVQGMLAEQGYEVVGIVGDGRSALEAVVQQRPDVVIMDVRMPEMDGIEATRRIQEICPTPVVVLTAHDGLELTSEAAEAGVGGYLVKPPKARELARAITVARARFKETQSLSSYAHTVAHDLKNAMTPIVGVAQLLSEGLETTPVEAARDQLDMIAESGQELSRMVDDLLTLAEVSDRNLSLTVLDMTALVTEAQTRLAPLVEDLDAQIDAPCSWPETMGSEAWVTEIWFNYMSNALKYGGRPPQVTLGWEAVPSGEGYVRFWVRDNGRGLSVEEQAALFRRYTRLRPSESEGKGLGLSIVQRVVERLGGEVGVESELGQGSTFWFTLPAAPGERQEQTRNNE